MGGVVWKAVEAVEAVVVSPDCSRIPFQASLTAKSLRAGVKCLYTLYTPTVHRATNQRAAPPWTFVSRRLIFRPPTILSLFSLR